MVNNIQIIIEVSRKAYDKHHQAIDNDTDEQNEEKSIILDSYAVIEPHTVMIEMFSTSLAAATVFGKVLDICVAMVAEIIVSSVVKLLFC